MSMIPAVSNDGDCGIGELTNDRTRRGQDEIKRSVRVDSFLGTFEERSMNTSFFLSFVKLKREIE